MIFSCHLKGKARTGLCSRSAHQWLNPLECPPWQNSCSSYQNDADSYTAAMKKCPYCGALYPDDATLCAIDQTPFEEPATTRTGPSRRNLDPSVTLAIKTALAAFLINTGIYFIVGRTYLIIFNTHHPKHFLPSNAIEIVLTPAPIRWILMAEFFCFTCAVCLMRCRTKWQAVVAATVAFCMTAVLLLRGMFPVVFLPACFVGLLSNSTLGYIFGSLLQITIGIWLLNWFRQPAQPDGH